MRPEIDSDAEQAEPRLHRDLSGRQVRMIAIGGAVGTGLFLGSGLAISLGGPAVILLYAVGALLAWTLAYALAEMTVAHPEPGGFGRISRMYLGPLASFVQRWSYWFAQVVNIGSEATAAGIYLKFWWPDLPLWLPIAAFSVIMLGINAAAVRFFGEFEYWFAMIKVLAIIVFVVLGIVAITVGLPGQDPAGLSNWTEHGGFLPNGVGGLWLAMTVVSFSFLGTEAISLTAAESRDPDRDVPKAAKGTVLRLTLFYVLSMLVILTIVPWNAAGDGEDVTKSPFVLLFDAAGIPGAAGLMNFVVLVAALSAMNANMFITSRMAHSLALDGAAPRRLAKLTTRGTPGNALLLSGAGGVLAAAVAAVASEQAFAILLGIAVFNALVAWFLIFASHLVFRRRNPDRSGAPIRLIGAPVTTVLAMAFIVVIFVTMAFTEQFWTALVAGVPFLLVVAIAYLLTNRRTVEQPPASARK